MTLKYMSRLHPTPRTRWRFACSMALAALGVGACGYAAPTRLHCARGSQPMDGSCIPTATVVFRQCVEAFRQESVAHERGRGVSVGGSANGAGSAQVEHQVRDVEHTRYAAVDSGSPEVTMEAIVQECRRQEEAERAQQLARAWEAADEQSRRADAALRDAETLREALATEEASAAQAKLEREALAAELEARGEAFAELRSALAEFRPCLAEQWEACAAAARTEHEAGEYTRAHEAYAAACGAGQLEACGAWGILFEHGLGTPEDGERARELYADACQAGDHSSCVRGVVASGEDSRASKKSRARLAKACRAGVGRGCTVLASTLESMPERSGDASQERITDLYAQGCELEDASGCVSLGLRYEAGLEVPRDLAQARKLHARACDLGDEDGCLAEARLVRLAQGNRVNPVRPGR